MRKIRILGIAVFAVLALGAMATTSFGAVSQILVNGAKFESGSLLVFVKGEILLEDSGAGAAVLCSGWFNVDLIGATGGVVLGEFLGITNLSGTEETSVECTGQKTCEGTKNVVTPVNFPWNADLELMTGSEEYLLVILDTEASKDPGYMVDCNTIIGLITDECKGQTSAWLLTLTSSTLEGEFNASSEAGNCSVGGTGTGLVTGTGEIVHPEGVPLALSEA